MNAHPTIDGGNPVADNQNFLSASPRDLLLLQDHQLLEKLAHQNRERTPVRTVRAKGLASSEPLPSLMKL